MCVGAGRAEDQGPHALRHDTSWFCGEECKRSFTELADAFQLPPDFGKVSLVDSQPVHPAGSGLAYTQPLGIVLYMLPGVEGKLWPGLVSRPSTEEQRAEAKQR